MASDGLAAPRPTTSTSYLEFISRHRLEGHADASPGYLIYLTIRKSLTEYTSTKVVIILLEKFDRTITTFSVSAKLVEKAKIMLALRHIGLLQR